jgi:hypothetical protein
LSGGRGAGCDEREGEHDSAKRTKCRSLDCVWPRIRPNFVQDDRLKEARAHPSRKNKGAARVGHPGLW